MNIRELHTKCVQWQFHELADGVLEIADSAIYGGAPLHDAQDALETLNNDLDDLIEEATTTPTAEDLACKFGAFECLDCD